MVRPFHLKLWTTVGVLVLDQLSKQALLRTFAPLDGFPVLKGFFNIVHIRNRGMAFGLLNHADGLPWRTLFLLSASLAAIIVLLWWMTRLKPSERMLSAGLSLVLGGALGNLIDRLVYGEVIDFLDFYVGSYHWPAFNVADAAITVGTAFIGIAYFRESRSAAST